MSGTSNRMGGRAARQALRAAPIPEEKKPVRPGLTSGRYQPLTQEQVLRIHEAALTTLETIGFANALPSCIELVTKAGGSLTADGRLLMPREPHGQRLRRPDQDRSPASCRPGLHPGLIDARRRVGAPVRVPPASQRGQGHGWS